MAVFGKYEVLKRIGVGGMAEVLLVRQTGIEGFEKLLVLKKLLPQMADSPDLVEMFLDEARLAAQLNHPNIVQIYDLGRAADQYFIVMEHVNGVDLKQLLAQQRAKKGFVPLSHAIKIMCYVCEALTYAHSRTNANGQPLGLVHRDVSAQNVLVAFDGGVKLTDFGIAKVTSLSSKTQAGMIKGKFSYVSPEQVKCQGVDHRSDIFSAGVLLYELTTSSLPFVGSNDVEILTAVVQNQPLPAAAIRPDTPAGLQRVLDRALTKDPALRYPSAFEMQMDLERLLLERTEYSNVALIGQYVGELFSEVIAAQAKVRQESSSVSAVILAGLEKVQRISTPSRTGGSPAYSAGRATPAKQKTPAPAKQKTPTPRPVTPLKQKTPLPAKQKTPTPVKPRTPLPTLVEPATDPDDLSQEQTVPETENKARRPRHLLATAIIVLLLLAGVGGANWIWKQESASVVTPAMAITPPEPALREPQPSAATVQVVLPPAQPAAKIHIPPEPKPNGPEFRKPPRIPKVRTKGARSAAAAAARQATPPEAPAAEGMLNIDSVPWSEVWLGRQKLGLTPLAYRKLPAGRHTIVLRNPEVSLERTIRVIIRSAETTAVTVDLNKP